MKAKILLLIISIHFQITYAQTWQWAKGLDLSPQDVPKSLGIDKYGNIYYSAIAKYITGGSGSYYYNVLYKLDSTGNLIWADTLTTAISSSVTDTDGFTYVAGSTLSKYDSNGSLIWQLPYASQTFIEINLTPSGDIIVIGSTIIAGHSTRFVSKYDQNGVYKWSVIGGNVAGAELITSDNSGNIFVGGLGYRDSVSENQGFVVKLDPSGNILKFKYVPQMLTAIDIDESQNLIITGKFSTDTINIDGVTFTNPTNYSTFVIKYNSDFILQWYKIWTGTHVGCTSISTDLNQNIYVTGWYHTSMIADAYNLSSPGTALFVFKLDSSGFLSNISYSVGTGSSAISGSTYPKKALLHNESLFIAGGISGTHTFGSLPQISTTFYPDLLLCKMNLFSTVGVMDIEKIKFSIFPNPTGNTINILCSDMNCKQLILSIKNNLGQTVYSVSESNIGSEYQKSIDLSQQNKGIYFIEIIADDKRMVKKVILQ